MKKLFIFLCALALVFSVIGSASASTITNGSFESGFLGWDTIGNVAVKGGPFKSGPTHGAAQALITTRVASQPDSTLETWLGLAPGMLDVLGNGDATVGSAIKQDISVQAGQILTFDWNFLTNDFYLDFAFYSIAPAAIELADTFDPLVSSSTIFDEETGYSTESFIFAATGTYTLGFGVVHVGDEAVNSGLLVDNVSAVPVPPALLLLGSGLAGLAVLKRRRESRTSII